jgi:hypothetical protein
MNFKYSNKFIKQEIKKAKSKKQFKMYIFRELLEIDLEEARDFVFVVNGYYFIGGICVRNREDEWILFENRETQTQAVVYLNKSEELYLCIAEQEERKPEIAIADKFEVYKPIRN